LLTLAAGLMQTLEHKVYSEIIMTRVTVPVGEDIGFLPGTEEEKMTPWMNQLVNRDNFIEPNTADYRNRLNSSPNCIGPAIGRFKQTDLF